LRGRYCSNAAATKTGCTRSGYRQGGWTRAASPPHRVSIGRLDMSSSPARTQLTWGMSAGVRGKTRCASMPEAPPWRAQAPFGMRQKDFDTVLQTTHGRVVIVDYCNCAYAARTAHSAMFAGT